MAGNFKNLGKDSFDINELAALNDDIPDELISQLEQQLTEKIDQSNGSNSKTVNENDDSTLFEETASAAPNTASPETAAEANSDENVSESSVQSDNPQPSETSSDSKTDGNDSAPKTDKDGAAQKTEKIDVQNFDDNFIKKYKAKLKSRAQGGGGDKGQGPSYGGVAPSDEEFPDNNLKNRSNGKNGALEEGDISELSQGKISERALTGDMKSYKDSLDFLDKNVKYTKYVIYIDPQNVDFIESLTVKERKNLINGILRQQDDIAITKLRFKVLQTIIRHALITILTVAISIPVVYYVINASIEATINNHRSAQTNWQTLYKEHGKITPH